MNIYSTSYLVELINQVKAPDQFILNLLFPLEVESTTEEIAFDVVTGSEGLAPFVAPSESGKVIKEEGYRTDTFKPAYVKPLTPLPPNGAVRRVAGESIGGSLSPAERQELRLASTLSTHKNMVDRRLVWMAMQALRTGKVVVKGDKYPERTVDFGKAPQLRVVKAAGTKWTDNGVSIVDDLAAFSQLTLDHGKAGADILITSSKVFAVMLKNEEFMKEFDRKAVNPGTLQPNLVATVGAKFQGTCNGFEVWTYSDSYVDDDENVKQMLPDDEILLTSRAVQGVRAYGAIMDEAAGLAPFKLFPKSWVPEDPAIRQVLTQSAPLAVPTNINATLSAVVL